MAKFSWWNPTVWYLYMAAAAAMAAAAGDHVYSYGRKISFGGDKSETREWKEKRPASESIFKWGSKPENREAPAVVRTASLQDSFAKDLPKPAENGNAFRLQRLAT